MNGKDEAALTVMAAALERLLEETDVPPAPNCSCHLAPPCGDCVEWGGLREARAEAEQALQARHTQLRSPQSPVGRTPAGNCCSVSGTYACACNTYQPAGIRVIGYVNRMDAGFDDIHRLYGDDNRPLVARIPFGYPVAILSNGVNNWHEPAGKEQPSSVATKEVRVTETADFQHGLKFILSCRDTILRATAGPSEHFVVERTLEALAAQPAVAEGFVMVPVEMLKPPGPGVHGWATKMLRDLADSHEAGTAINLRCIADWLDMMEAAAVPTPGPLINEVMKRMAIKLALVQNGHPYSTPEPTARAFWGMLDGEQQKRYRNLARASLATVGMVAAPNYSEIDPDAGAKAYAALMGEAWENMGPEARELAKSLAD